MRSPRVDGSVALLVCAAAVAGGALAAGGPTFRFEDSVGLFGNTREYGLVTDLADTTLAVGDTLALLTRFEQPDRRTPRGGIIAAVVEARLHDARDMNFTSVPSRAVYRLRALPAGAAEHAIGLAFAAPARAFAERNGCIESDLDADGIAERYSECASYEGLHFEVWEGGEPWVGEPLADIYHYFPFDLEPNCPGMEPVAEESTPGPDSSSTAPPTSSK